MGSAFGSATGADATVATDGGGNSAPACGMVMVVVMEVYLGETVGAKVGRPRPRARVGARVRLRGSEMSVLLVRSL